MKILRCTNTECPNLGIPRQLLDDVDLAPIEISIFDEEGNETKETQPNPATICFACHEPMEVVEGDES
jgi:hypothetical protein